MNSPKRRRTRRAALALAGGLALGALVLGPALGASAATAHGAAPAVLTAGRILPATTQSVGGGLWQYGRDGAPFGTSWSHYHHATKYHSATACNGAIFQTCKQVTAAKNVWAKASVAASIFGNTAYWNTY
jgi:lactococcin 972 family bacteriocin